MSKEEKSGWKLDDVYTLYFEKNGVVLEWKSPEIKIKKIKGVKHEVHNTKTFYYGVLYQALKSYAHKKMSEGDFEDIHNIKKILADIDFVMDSIEQKYRVVKIVK